MSETSIFGDDSMVLKTSFAQPRVVAEAYQLVSNTYGDACNEAPELKGFLSEANSEIGSLQGNTDNTKASEVSEFRHFEATEHNGHMVFESYTPEIESDFHKETIISDIQEQLRENLAEMELATPSGNSGEPESDDDSDDSKEQQQERDMSDSDMEAVFERMASKDEGVSGIGDSTVQKLRKWLVANEVSIDHTDIEMEVDVTDKYDSLDEVPAKVFGELTTDQIETIRA